MGNAGFISSTVPIYFRYYLLNFVGKDGRIYAAIESSCHKFSVLSFNRSMPVKKEEQLRNSNRYPQRAQHPLIKEHTSKYKAKYKGLHLTV